MSEFRLTVCKLKSLLPKFNLYLMKKNDAPNHSLQIRNAHGYVLAIVSKFSLVTCSFCLVTPRVLFSFPLIFRCLARICLFFILNCYFRSRVCSFNTCFQSLVFQESCCVFCELSDLVLTLCFGFLL